MIYVYEITSDDDELSNEDIARLDTVESVPSDAQEITSNDFFAANFAKYRIYQDNNEILYFVPR
jgi:hypothetical protein